VGEPGGLDPRGIVLGTGNGVEIRRAVDGWLERYSVLLLRISMGAVIFGFGVLKYFPGVSPAQSIVLAVSHRLTFGLIPDRATLILFATVESLIGLSLITGWGLRMIIYPLTVWAVAILSPVVLMPGRLFSGPDHAPTLEGQYVLKDVILLTACLVIAAHVRRNRVHSRGRLELARRGELILRG
jgi:putative oxidoreductase